MFTFLGPQVRGATRWLEIGSFRLQPSELAKPFFLVSISSLLVRYPPMTLKRIGMHMTLVALPFILVFQQPDLGNALIYLTSWLAMILLSGIPLIAIILGGVITGIILPLSSYFVKEYQKQRILTFLDPLLDPHGAGYNSIQAMIAVGSGRLLGSGFGRGTQSLLQFLPERHTDFIFASFTEEFGFVGAAALIAIFYLMLWQLLRHAFRVREQLFAHLYIVGLFALLLGHFVINVGMNIGLLPITGITLPLVSYGGSSLLAIFIGLGIYEASRINR